MRHQILRDSTSTRDGSDYLSHHPRGGILLHHVVAIYTTTSTNRLAHLCCGQGPRGGAGQDDMAIRLNLHAMDEKEDSKQSRRPT